MTTSNVQNWSTKVSVKFDDIEFELEVTTHNPNVDIGVSRSLIFDKEWEPFESQLILRAIHSAQAFFDIGANIGYYTLLASAAGGVDLQIMSFEPDDENYEILQENIDNLENHNIKAYKAALGAESTSARILKSANNFGDHSIILASELEDAKAIPVLSIDQLIEEGIQRPDLIKVDTQGAEIDILIGMREYLTHLGVNDLIFIEFWPYGVSRYGGRLEIFWEVIRSFDLDVFAIFEEAESIYPCSWSDLSRWAETILDISSERYINLLLCHQSCKKIKTVVSPYSSDLRLNIDQITQASSSAGLANHLIPAGWSYPEELGVWSAGSYSEMTFRPPVLSQDFTLILFVAPFLTEEVNEQQVVASVNGATTKTIALQTSQQTCIELPIPATTYTRQSVVSFHFPNAVSPKDAGVSNDTRQLSLFLYRYKLISG